MCYPTPSGDIGHIDGAFDERPMRLDLDDLNGEICLLDWLISDGEDMPQVSLPNRHLPTYNLMNGKINLVLVQEDKKADSSELLHQRMTMLDPRDHGKLFRVFIVVRPRLYTHISLLITYIYVLRVYEAIAKGLQGSNRSRHP